jgi:hypothetical protein
MPLFYTLVFVVQCNKCNNLLVCARGDNVKVIQWTVYIIMLFKHIFISIYLHYDEQYLHNRFWDWTESYESL